MFFLLFCNYLPLEKGGAFIWTNLHPLHQRILSAKLVEIGPMVLKKIKMLKVYDNSNNKNNRQRKNLDQKSSLELQLRWAKNPLSILWEFNGSSKDAWRRRFLNFVNVFLLFRNYLPLEKDMGLHLNNLNPLLFFFFVIISPWKRAGPFILTNLNSIHQIMLCAKFCWN